MLGPSGYGMGALCFLIIYMAIAASSNPCDAGTIEEPMAPEDFLEVMASSKSTAVEHLDHTDLSMESHSYAGAPLTLPPYEDVMGSPSPSGYSQGNPNYCIYPPPGPPNPPPTSFPSPIIYNQPPMSLLPPLLPPIYFSPPVSMPSPPSFMPSPNPPDTAPSPPNYEPGPPIVIPSPPKNPPIYMPPIVFVPAPPLFHPPIVFVPAPPLFQPPIVYPPPAAPPPPPLIGGFNTDLWCIAKSSVPDPILQEALDYACNSGADCNSIMPTGSCYNPDIVVAHASFAFNSYWQRTKVVGGSCDFGGTAMLVTEDPSFDGCHFLKT